MKLLALILSISLATLVTSAGSLKELIIEAEDAIYAEMYETAFLEVVAVADHDLKLTKDGVSVTANVQTSNPKSKQLQKWLCTVQFKKETTQFVVAAIDCN